MINFKQFLFLKESAGSDTDLDAEYEGLCDIFNHHLYSNELDPKLLAHMKGNAKLLKEDSPHKQLLQKSQEPPKNPKAQDTVKNNVRKALVRHEEAYGAPIGAPLTQQKAADLARNAVAEHYKKSPEEQQHALHAAARRLGHVVYNEKEMTPSALGKRIAGGNKKTDTVVNNDLAKHKGRTTRSVSSYGGAPGAYEHFHDSSMTKSSHTIQCPHGTTGCMVGQQLHNKNINASCLAMSGGYNFTGTRSKVQINSHIRSGAHTIADHAIIAAHHMSNEADKAAKTGQVHSVRTQTTDQRGKEISAIADETGKNNPTVKKNTVLFGYSKNPKEVLEAARKRKTGEGIPEHIVHSHPGPAIHQDEEGKMRLNGENISHLMSLRKAHKDAEAEGLNTSDYIVAGGKSLDAHGNAVKNTQHRQPKSSAKPDELARFNHTDASVKKVRYWDLHHSGELKAGEAESHHDEKTGKGYTSVEQGGKRVKIGYYDRKANPGATASGKTEFHERHDARYADAENDKSYSHVTAPVASTSNFSAEGAHHNSLIHQMDVHFDKHGNKHRHSEAGMLHDAHPDLMKKAGFTYPEKK